MLALAYLVAVCAIAGLVCGHPCQDLGRALALTTRATRRAAALLWALGPVHAGRLLRRTLTHRETA